MKRLISFLFAVVLSQHVAAFPTVEQWKDLCKQKGDWQDTAALLLAGTEEDFLAWLRTPMRTPMEVGSPLHYVALNGHLKLLEHLLLRIPEPERVELLNQANEHGNTLLHLAVFRGHLEVVKWLAGIGANVNATNQHGSTPLHWAAMNGHLAVVQWLAGIGANVNATNQQDSTPLHWAAMNGRLAVVQWLVGNGSNVDATNQQDETPLYCAAQNGHQAVVDWLNHPVFNPFSLQHLVASKIWEAVGHCINQLKASLNRCPMSFLLIIKEEMELTANR